MIENSVFLDSLKQADIKSVYKKDFRNAIYELCMCTQMNKYFDPILSKCQFGFNPFMHNVPRLSDTL